MLFNSNGLRVLRARVVWQTAQRSGQPDLAVLHIPRHLDHTFAWGDEVRNGEPVLAVGLAWTNAPGKRLRGFALMAGKVLDQKQVDGVAGFRILATDVPLQSGDSGGPLVNEDGRLIGINVRGTPPLIHKVMPAGVLPMVAHLPSENEIRQLIEEDFASRCSERSTPLKGHSKQRRPGAETSSHMERIVVSPDGHGFVTRQSKQPFRPWGMNYGNSHRLMEDFWDLDWETFASDFREMKALGANVVRVHLQYGKFMKSSVEADPQAIKNYQRMLKLADEVGVYLDVTGLACYRPSDVPEWYDAMDEPARWEAQARFWEIIAEAGNGSSALFCYNLINEPLSPAEKREPGKWSSGSLFGDYDFLQYIALEQAGRKREDIAVNWIRRLSAGIRKHDKQTLITVGLLPWSQQWKHLSGFLPKTVAPELDFLSVHLYPDNKKPGEEIQCLREFSVGKPLVIEETFPLSCSMAELEEFLLASRRYACGWIGHYDGATINEIDALENAGQMSMSQAVYRDWQKLFLKLEPEMLGRE